MMNWQLQEAKNKFSQVVREAQEHGPQIITVHGKEAAVVLSAEEYSTLKQVRKGSFLKFMQSSPWAEIDLDIERSKDTGRDIEL
jgi:prevent-host-death family protein